MIQARADVLRAGLVPALVCVLFAVTLPGCRQRRSGGGTEATLPPGAMPVTPLPSSSSQVEALVGARPQAGPDLTKSTPLSFAPIAKAADPAVVRITTVGEEVEGPAFFSNRVRRRELKGLGTGFLVDKDGLILTNNHVIEDASTITVQLADRREFPAKVVGRDPRTDIAVVKIDGKGDLPSLAFGDSEALEVGDWVVAIGNPFGLAHTVSAGIISAKGRTRDDVPLGDPSGYYDFLQTDASINPGNSGGPLLDLKGQVVGINTAVRGGGAQGIGFAIPISMVKQLLPSLVRDGHVTRSALGVTIKDVRELLPEDRAFLKLEAGGGGESGAVITQVGRGSGADKAGLLAGDVIVGFDGHPVDTGTHLQWLASTAGVGKTVTVRALREGKAFDLKVTLGELPELPAPSRAPAPGGLRPQAPRPDPARPENTR